jgi:hypothetical protein
MRSTGHDPRSAGSPCGERALFRPTDPARPILTIPSRWSPPPERVSSSTTSLADDTSPIVSTHCRSVPVRESGRDAPRAIPRFLSRTNSLGLFGFGLASFGSGLHGAGFAVLHLILLLVSSAGRLEAESEGDSREARRLLDAADTALARARERYRAGMAILAAAPERIRGLPRDLIERARDTRLAIAAGSLDYEVFVKIRKEASTIPGLGASAAGPAAIVPWAPVVPQGRPFDDTELERLVRVLGGVIDKYPKTGADPRDVWLALESLALVEIIRADAMRADAEPGVLRALEIARSMTPGALRLSLEWAACYRSRRFDAVIAFAARRGELALLAEPGNAGNTERCRRLMELEEAAAYSGRDELARAVRAERSKVCQKDVETARVAGRIGTRLIAPRAELVLMLGVFRRFLDELSLPPRSAALVAYMAARCAAEIGEHAVAAELLHGKAELAGDDAWLCASIHAQVSWLEDRCGDPESALEALAEAELAARSLANAELFRARLELHRARIEFSLGKLDDALRRAARLAQRAELPIDLRLAARLTAAACLFLAADGDPVRLVDARRTVTAVERDIPRIEPASERIDLELVTAIILGNILREEARRTGDPEAARTLRSDAVARQDKAMRAAHAAGRIELAAVAAGNAAELWLEAGALDAAQGVAQWSLDRATEAGLDPSAWRAHWYLGRIADARRDVSTAETHYARALGLIEESRGRIIDAEAKAGFMTDKQDFFRHIVAREIAARRPERALELVERGRARSLVESLGWRFVAFAEGDGSGLYREYIGLAGRAARLESTARASWLGAPASLGDYVELRTRLGELRARILASDRVSPALKALIDGAPIGFAELTRLLERDRALVEYFDIGRTLVAFIVEQGRVEIVELGVSRREIDVAVKTFVAGGAADGALGRRLFQSILEPVVRRVKTERLLIVPHGRLHALPFEALRTPRGFVIDELEISYLPSASLLRFTSMARGRASGAEPSLLRLLAFADPDTDYDRDGAFDKQPLAGARAEVSAFSSSFREPQVFYGKTAGEARLRTLRGESDVLHLACHGDFRPASPWNSVLFLAPDGEGSEGDGHLEAWEVYGIDLRGVRLVALSGCETGLADIAGGDDPVGISTAFIHGGTSALLVSLWKVEDRATEALMKAFYGYWIGAKLPRPAALRRAKLDLVAQGFGRPAQWASFVLVGDG